MTPLAFFALFFVVAALASLANGVLALWRSSARPGPAVVVALVPQARYEVLHLDVTTTDGVVRVPARRELSAAPVEVGQQVEVVLDRRRKIAWLDRPPRSLRVIGVFAVVLGVVLAIVGLGLLGVNASV